VMENGRRTMAPEPISRCRNRCTEEVDGMSESLTALAKAEHPYPVDLSPGLMRLAREITQRHKG